MGWRRANLEKSVTESERCVSWPWRPAPSEGFRLLFTETGCWVCISQGRAQGWSWAGREGGGQNAVVCGPSLSFPKNECQRPLWKEMKTLPMGSLLWLFTSVCPGTGAFAAWPRGGHSGRAFPVCLCPSWAAPPSDASSRSQQDARASPPPLSNTSVLNCCLPLFFFFPLN